MILLIRSGFNRQNFTSNTFVKEYSNNYKYNLVSQLKITVQPFSLINLVLLSGEKLQQILRLIQCFIHEGRKTF